MPEEVAKLLHAFSALADLAEVIADRSDLDEMVRTTLHIVLGALAIRRGLVAEYSRDAGFRAVTAWGMDGDDFVSLKLSGSDLELLRENGRLGLFAEDDALKTGATLSFELTAFIHQRKSEFLMPLVLRGELVGFILLGGKASGDCFTREDRQTIGAMARHIAVGIYNHRLLAEVERRADENRRYYEELRASYRDTVQAFATAIDIKDKYTQGHSERVGKYSELIAQEMGWSEEQVEGVAIAGFLHDIGKLIVERDLINAPYRLSAKETSDLRRHALAGYEILAPIHHPFADIPLIVRHHHERVDGRGYPDGLMGDEIPMGARIVTLADCFDAMTTDRPYRRRHEMREALSDLVLNTGNQFEPAVVHAFIRLFLRELESEGRDKRITKLLGKNYFEPQTIKPILEKLLVETEEHSFAGVV